MALTLTEGAVCVAVRSQRATGIGRLMVNIVEGIELKPCRSHGIKLFPLCLFVCLFVCSCECDANTNLCGLDSLAGKSNPYCEVTMGSQCHITKTLQV